MRRVVQSLLLATAVAVVYAPTEARADGFVSPWTGANFGSNIADGRASFGASAGYMGKGALGGEFDFGYSPSFFGTDNVFGNNNVMTAMGNLIVGIPIGGTHGAGVRPFAVGGIGLIRTSIDGPSDGTALSLDNNDFGFNLGGGVMGYFNNHVGLKGELRYFRNVQDNSVANNLNLDLGGFHFWRAAVGLVLR
jgi:hypothetical protein